MNALYQMKIQSVIVEGGARLLQSFIDEEMWDEARIIKNEKLIINNGLAAPELEIRNANEEIKILDDSINIYIMNWVEWLGYFQRDLSYLAFWLAKK